MSVDREQVAETLERAADLIETLGWVKGMWDAPDGSVCVSTAIDMACSTDTRRAHFVAEPRADRVYTCRRALHDALDVIDIVRWNDEPLTTKQDILDGLRKAAVREREVVEP